MTINSEVQVGSLDLDLKYVNLAMIATPTQPEDHASKRGKMYTRPHSPAWARIMTVNATRAK